MRMNPNTPLVLGCTGISMLMCVLVALAAPVDVIATSPLLRAYTDVLRNAIPGIDRLARISSFPEVTRLVVSIMWTSVLVLTVVYYRGLAVVGPSWEQHPEKRSYPTLAMILMAGSVVGLAVLYDFESKDLEGDIMSKQLLRSMSTSRVALGIIAGFFGSAIALLASIVLRRLREFRTIHFAERGGDRS